MIYELNGVAFEWNEDKAKLVFKEHQVTFIEACTVFFDDLSITKEDSRDYGEMRQVTIGMSSQLRLLTVVWTMRDNIRLITAFKANKSQKKEYNYG